jgi:hypothetical protein
VQHFLRRQAVGAAVCLAATTRTDTLRINGNHCGKRGGDGALRIPAIYPDFFTGNPVTRYLRGPAAAFAALLLGLAMTLATDPAQAARIGVLSNKYSAETAADFNARITGHTFTGVDLSLGVPTLASLTAAFDSILLFEDATFANAPLVGATVASYAQSGRAVVLGTFYEQDRSDGALVNTPHGWGPLENLDPNTTDGVGTPYVPRSLDIATLSPHPLTAGLTALTSTRFAGGNQVKPGSNVVARWAEPNARGQVDPAIAYRVTAGACVIHVAIAPHYLVLPGAAGEVGGDFYRAWSNAFGFAAGGCASDGGAVPPDPNIIPTLSGSLLALTALLLAGIGFASRRRLARR